MADRATANGLPADVDATLDTLTTGEYVAGRDLATVIFLALSLGRPLLLEGEAGVGKTEVAKVLSSSLDRELIRLQCFEGLDLANAAYEWDYPRQMVAIRLAEAERRSRDGVDAAAGDALRARLYSREFLIERPLLRSLEAGVGAAPVLLIDEIDRADEPFEAFLLELLSDFQLTIPEFGTVRATEPPIVVITSNRTREVHDALRRRCLYHWVDYPSLDAERRIVELKAPAVGAALREQLIEFVHALRERDLFKAPGVAETIDWANALTQLDVVALDGSVIDDTLGSLLKYQDDIARIRGSEAAQILTELDAQG